MASFISLFAFQQETDTPKPTKQEIIQEELNKKLNEYRKNNLKRCRKDALTKAEEVVDSILLARARSERQDSIPRPIIPPKPNIPDALQASDSDAIAPIVEDTFRRTSKSPVNESLKQE